MTMKKTAISTAMAMAMGTAAMVPQIAAADTVNFDWDGVFTIVDPNGAILSNPSVTTKGANTFQTPINGTFTFDTATGAGTGTVDPFDFFGNPHCQRKPRTSLCSPSAETWSWVTPCLTGTATTTSRSAWYGMQLACSVT